MRNFLGRFWIIVGMVFLTLTACIVPEKEDPFERLPEEQLETISGKLFPFSVSVSTRATHRLELEGKLVGYLSSDLVQLADFEGREVALDGVWRNEKMRQIFWVEAIRIEDLETEEDLEEANEPLRFTTKKFTFLYPDAWEYSLSPAGIAYFLNKEDPTRKVFLTFAVEDYSPEETRLTTNILLNGFSGIKDLKTDENKKEKETITLFSNLENKKYVFNATYEFEDFDTKKAVFDLLNSFAEGEEKVQEILEEEAKAKAEKEAQKIVQEEEAKPDDSEDETSKEEADEPSFFEKLLEPEPEVEVAPEPEREPSEVSMPTSVSNVDTRNFVSGNFKNLIDNRAYSYNSDYYGLHLKAPFGYWYQNYGPSYGVITELGFADNALNSRADVKFWLKLLAKDSPSAETQEIINDQQITLIKKRDESSVFEVSGPASYRDAMWSVLESIQ